MTTRKSLNLLVNAEPFGFGPSSAIADCFPRFDERFQGVTYIGSSHTLDLHSSLPYNEIHPLEGTQAEQDVAFKKIVKEFDGFFTALDFRLASLAIEMGVPCVIYDPLTWFWRTIPSVISDPNVLYMAQGFHGVQDTLAKEKERISNVRVVPPLVKRSDFNQEKKLIVVNLGGLMNPFWSLNDCVSYATTIAEAASNAFRKESDDLIVLGNKHLQSALPNYKVMTCTRQEMQEILPRTRLAISTPGLGNIYESAAHNIPTLFLPPPGDSHGQQLQVLRKHGQVDEFIDWQTLDDSLIVDYCAEQEQVMHELSQNIRMLTSSKSLQNKLSLLIQEKCGLLAHKISSNTSQLLNQFGENGAAEIAQLAHQFIQSKGKHVS